MKTIEINLYKFEELSEEAKQTAINKYNDINVDYQWWDSAYEDAAEIGLKITGFDIGRAMYCEGEFILSANEVSQNIINTHGEKCHTYKTAVEFMEEWQPVFNNYMDESHKNYESPESEGRLIEIEDQFLYDICEDYRIILSNEWDYLNSEEAIIETLISNDYDFTEDGTMY